MIKRLHGVREIAELCNIEYSRLKSWMRTNHDYPEADAIISGQWSGWFSSRIPEWEKWVQLRLTTVDTRFMNSNQNVHRTCPTCTCVRKTGPL